ncbi:MAG: HAMP domain-containing protein [Desulfobacterales bacterium]|nr:MAG: HAMP domain-containing protein [Desulfobacterales bacterium]
MRKIPSIKTTTDQNIFLSKIKNMFRKSPGGYSMTIGEVLRKREIVTEEQLQDALRVQKEKLNSLGRAVRLGQIIVELGYASEEELVDAVNQEYEISVESLKDDIKGLVKERRGSFVEGLPAHRIHIWLQLFGATIFIIIITIFLLSFVTLRQQKERLYRQTIKIGRVSLNYFTSNASVPLLNDNILRLNTLIKDAAAVEGLIYAIIIDHNRIVKAHTDIRKIETTFENFNNVKDVKKEQDFTYFDYISASGEHILNLTRPIVFKEKTLGEVHVGVSIDFIKKLINKERLTIILLTFFIVLIGVAIAILLGFRFSKPLSHLVLATQEIGAGNYRHKIVLARNDELGNLATAFNRMGSELWKNSLMQKSFGKYVGSEVLDMIMADPESAWLKGRKNEATIVFTDIRGFTSYSEANEPEIIVERLNEYFEIATRSIQDHDGYVDKFIGDAVLGVFGVPIYHPDHVERAVRAALDMQEKFQQEKENGKDILQSVGIGINTGVVVSGNIGSANKMEYTVIGDSVNVASRLNGLAKSGEIIISKSVFDHLSELIDVEVRSQQYVKGKSEPVETFKVLGIKEKRHARDRK